MFTSDRKLRIYGLVSFFAMFYVFYQSLVFFYQYQNLALLIAKTLAVSVFFAVTIWEPTRWFILQTRKKWGADRQTAIRKIILALILIPYAAIIGLIRTILEDQFIWRLPWKEPSFSIPMVGSNLLFILVEVALYESFFFVQKWHNSAMEARELKKLYLQMQFDSLKLQIQPHFLFNTLNTLVGLIELDQKRAVQFTRELAYVYRYLLAAHDRQLINLEEEFKFSNAYFFLIKTRYPDGLYIDMQLNDEDLTQYLLPPLSIQILIENAMKHNIITRAKPLYITISLDKKQQLMVISNNLQRKEDDAKSGMGLIHLRKKFELNNMQGLHILDDGSTFSVSMPLKKTDL